MITEEFLHKNSESCIHVDLEVKYDTGFLHWQQDGHQMQELRKVVILSESSNLIIFFKN